MNCRRESSQDSAPIIRYDHLNHLPDMGSSLDPHPLIVKLPTGSGYEWSCALGSLQPPGMRAVESRVHRTRPRKVQPAPPQNAGASGPRQIGVFESAPSLKDTDTLRNPFLLDSLLVTWDSVLGTGQGD
jgi:hypothetical protein